MKVERKCKVIAKEWLTRDAVSMTLDVGDMLYHARTVEGQSIYPGQFVHIKCGDGLLLRRPDPAVELRWDHGAQIFLVFCHCASSFRALVRASIPITGPQCYSL